MKFRSKLQFLPVLLAAAVCGQELVHAAFHSHADARPGGYQQQASGKLRLKRTGNRQPAPDLHLKTVCPACNSAAGKSAPESSVAPRIAGHPAVIRPCLNESFTFSFFSRIFSRGPPRF